MASTALTAVTVAIVLVGEDTAGEAEDDEDGAGEADVEARMRPAKGVFLARQGEGRFSGSATSVSVGDADSVAFLGEAGADAEAAADIEDAADNDGEPASAATAAVSTTSPSAMVCFKSNIELYSNPTEVVM